MKKIIIIGAEPDPHKIKPENSDSFWRRLARRAEEMLKMLSPHLVSQKPISIVREQCSQCQTTSARIETKVLSDGKHTTRNLVRYEDIPETVATTDADIICITTAAATLRDLVETIAQEHAASYTWPQDRYLMAVVIDGDKVTFCTPNQSIPLFKQGHLIEYHVPVAVAA
ncbi:MAG: hypothetical protein FGM57_01890 [Candidatus Taylorbacteria bacterium]|nr:hypothetical protein [Candidatus Taylorbacteria bacterium]